MASAHEELDLFAQDLYRSLPRVEMRAFFDRLIKSCRSGNPLDRARAYHDHHDKIIAHARKKTKDLLARLQVTQEEWQNLAQTITREQANLETLKAELRMTMQNLAAAERIIARQKQRVKKLVAENAKQIQEAEKKIQVTQAQIHHELARIHEFQRDMQSAHRELAEQTDGERIKRVVGKMDLATLQFLKESAQ